MLRRKSLLTEMNIEPISFFCHSLILLEGIQEEESLVLDARYKHSGMTTLLL